MVNFFLLTERLKELINRQSLKRDGKSPQKYGWNFRHDYFHHFFASSGLMMIFSAGRQDRGSEVFSKTASMVHVPLYRG
jgi:hypothetical protein